MKILKKMKCFLAVILAAGLLTGSVETTALADEIGIGSGVEFNGTDVPIGAGAVFNDGDDDNVIAGPGPVVPAPLQTPAAVVSIANRLVANIPEGAVLSFDKGSMWSAPISGGTFALSDDAVNQLKGVREIWAKQPGDNVTALDSQIQIVRLSDSDFPEPPPIIIPVKRPTPNASFEASTMILGGVPSPGAYSLDGGNGWNSASGTFPVSGVSADAEILVKAVGDGSTTLDSDVQTIYITKADRPTGVSTNPVNTIGGTGAIVHVNPDMEYRASGAPSWTAIGGNSVTGLGAGDYDVRVRAGGTRLASDYVTVTIAVIQPKKADKPNASFDGASMVLSGVGVGMAISYNGGGSWETITDNHCTHVTLTASQASQAISCGGIQVKRLGDGQTTIDSDIQTAPISKAATPSGLSASAATNGNNGVIQNVATDMQYIKEGTNFWTDIGSNTISGLAAGTYDIRRKANGSMIASDICKVSVLSNPVPSSREAKPAANFNAMNMTLSNVRGIRYATDGGSNYRDAGNVDAVTLNESELRTDKGIRLYRPGNKTTTADSDVQYIELHRQAVPTGISATSATNISGGIIKGTSSMMEYKPANASGWTPISGDMLTGLTQGTYYIRTKGAYQSLPSEAIAVVINMTAAPAVVTPTPVKPADNTTKPAADTNNTKKEETKDKKTQAEIDAEKKKEDEAAKAEAAKLREESEKKAEESQTEKEPTPEAEPSGSQPVLAGAPEKKGWGAIEAHMDSNPVVVEMNGTTEVPGSVLAAAKETGSELILGMSNDMVWSIEASAISSNVSDVDMGIVENARTIPQEVLASAASEGKVEKQFDLKHEGDFGFAAKLTIKIDAGLAGKYANLMYYNKAANEMENIGSSKINEKGETDFLLTHASSYAVVVTEKEMTQTAAAGSSPANTVKSEKQSNSGWIWFVAIAVLVLVIALAAVLYMRRKQAIENARRRQSRHNAAGNTIHHVEHKGPGQK